MGCVRFNVAVALRPQRPYDGESSDSVGSVWFSVAVRQQRPYGLLGTVRALTQRVENRTDLGKCTHQCDGKQGNNSTQALSTKIVFFGCKKRDGQQKRKEPKKRTDNKDLMYKKMLRISFLGGFKFNAAMYVHRDRTDCWGQGEL